MLAAMEIMTEAGSRNKAEMTQTYITQLWFLRGTDSPLRYGLFVFKDQTAKANGTAAGIYLSQE